MKQILIYLIFFSLSYGFSQQDSSKFTNSVDVMVGSGISNSHFYNLDKNFISNDIAAMCFSTEINYNFHSAKRATYSIGLQYFLFRSKFIDNKLIFPDEINSDGTVTKNPNSPNSLKLYNNHNFVNIPLSCFIKIGNIKTSPFSIGFKLIPSYNFSGKSKLFLDGVYDTTDRFKESIFDLNGAIASMYEKQLKQNLHFGSRTFLVG